MDCPKQGSTPQPLSDLARQLRLHHSSVTRKNGSLNSQGGDVGDHGSSRSETARRAAVLICIFLGDAGELRVLLTQRSSSLSSHSGQVALPGGKMDKTDRDEVATALREAQEEVGLDPSLVDVVCVLQPYRMNGMFVVPVIGLLYDKSAFHPTPNVAEVEAIFDAPLEMFLKDENRREDEKEWTGEKFLIHYFDYEVEGRKYVIFAFTAAVLIGIASLVYQREPAFSEMHPVIWKRVRSSL